MVSVQEVIEANKVGEGKQEDYFREVRSIAWHLKRIADVLEHIEKNGLGLQK